MARIKTTPTVRFALWALRIYLLILLMLIGIKFVRVFSSAQKQGNAATNRPATAAEATNQGPAQAKP
jgi:hypothetical protein